nr:unnamed protein product [Callosobruchus chinensis]
MFDRLDPQT